MDRGHDASAQIEHAGDFRPGKRHAGNIGGFENILHATDRQTEQLAGGGESDVFGEAAGIVHDGHAARSMSALCSLMAAISPTRSNLATKSWKPTARPRSIASAETMVASAMMGMPAEAGVARIVSASAKPSMSGISMSVTTRSKRASACSTANASAAEPTAVTV